MFEWDSGNDWKPARHGLAMEDAVAPIADPHRLVFDLGIVNGEPRMPVIGRIGDGRIVATVVAPRGSRLRVVTIYPVRRGRYYRAYMNRGIV